MNPKNAVVSGFTSAFKERKWPEHTCFLLAISGGMDSMTAAHLFEHHTELEVQWAHVNFGLRGDESDGDAAWLQQEAHQRGIKLHVNHAATEAFARENHQSIQMAARELRYRFFDAVCEQLMAQGKHPVLVTAHHADDQAETVLLNLVRGKHPLSWAGMEGSNPRAFRPLLGISRASIAAYAEENRLEYREDSSNASDHYQRNLLRNRVFPLLRDINPQFTQHLREASQEASIWIDLAKKAALPWLESATVPHEQGKAWPLEVLRDPARAKALELYLLEWGFTDWEALRNQIDNPRTGARFQSGGTEILIDRELLILRHTESSERLSGGRVFAHADELLVTERVPLGSQTAAIVLLNSESKQTFDSDAPACSIDLDSLRFPVEIRRWQPGDRIQPLGMTGQKKVKDVLIDRKIDRFTKDDTWVLVDAVNVACILFHTVSERVKVRDSSVRIVQLRRD